MTDTCLVPWAGLVESDSLSPFSVITLYLLSHPTGPVCTSTVDSRNTECEDASLAGHVQVCDSGHHSGECSGTLRLLAASASVLSSQKGKQILSFWFPIITWLILGGAQELKFQTPDCSLQFRQELLENAPPDL